MDFYPNGGKSQTGCGLDLGGVCSHIRAVEFLVESINSFVGFVGQKCESYSSVSSTGCEFENVFKVLGEEDDSEEGVFWFKTNDEPPFALG